MPLQLRLLRLTKEGMTGKEMQVCEGDSLALM